MPHDVPVPTGWPLPQVSLNTKLVEPEETITTYEHCFGDKSVDMAVFGELQGRHKERCLCFRCKKFVPEDRDANCPVANLLYALCVQCDLVLPVAECRADRFEPRETLHPWLVG